MGLNSLRLSSSQRDSLEQATSAYQAQLDEEANGYLIGRGLDREAAHSFRLGVVREAMQGHEAAVGRISLPYITPAGVVALKFRAIDDSEPKYTGPAGQRSRIFNARDFFRSDSDVILLCEGEFDPIIGSAMLGVPSVGLPGVSAFEDWWPRCFADYDRVLIVTDNDFKEDGSNPGQKAARKWADLLPQGIVTPPPRGEDLNSWFVKEGREAVLKGLGITV